jgi:hypothetical protein
MRFGAFVPAPEIDAGGYFALSETNPGEGRFRWDLSEPMRALRPLVLFLHPLEAAQKLVRDAGIEAVCQRAKVPQLQTGVHAVTVVANLPAQPAGAHFVGVQLEAPPKKPFRPQPQVQTVELKAPGFEGTVLLRLSPKELLDYQYQTYVVQEFNGQVRRWDGAARPYQEARLLLSPDDFPVTFIVIKLTPSLARVASSVTGRLCYKLPQAEDSVTVPFAFGAGHDCLTLAIPNDSEEATLTFDMVSPDGGQTLHTGPVPARHLTLDLHAFPQYGPHIVEIDCEFPKGVAVFAIDLRAEKQPETAITVLHFTPNQPKKTWSWNAESPFQPGFVYRKHALAGETAAWSEVQGPFKALHLRAF